MRLRGLVCALAALSAVSACAAQPSADAPGGVRTSDARDCAVLTAVISQHFTAEERAALRLVRQDGRGDFRITCDFAAAGLTLRDHDGQPLTADPGSWRFFGFGPPQYPTDTTATVETSAVWGPLAGRGMLCMLDIQADGWRVRACPVTWIS